MKTSGNALLVGLGGLVLGTVLVEGGARKEVRALTDKLNGTERSLAAARAEVSRERQMRLSAEHTRDDQRRIAGENAAVIATRNAEVTKLKGELAKATEELAKLRAESPKPKEEKKEGKHG